MLIRPVEGLGYLSTVITDETAGVAAVVDPRRDVYAYSRRPVTSMSGSPARLGWSDFVPRISDFSATVTARDPRRIAEAFASAGRSHSRLEP